MRYCFIMMDPAMAVSQNSACTEQCITYQQKCVTKHPSFKIFTWNFRYLDFLLECNQCCGSMTFWCGSRSGSADPCLWLMDPDPAIFHINANQKLIFKNIFSAYYFLKAYFTSFFKDKKSKRSHNAVGIKVFLLFLLGVRIRLRIRIRIHTSD